MSVMYLLAWFLDATEPHYHEISAIGGETVAVGCHSGVGYARLHHEVRRRCVRTPRRTCPICKGSPVGYWRDRVRLRKECD